MGKSNHLEDLKITVMKTTAQDLRRISEETGLAIGEAVDRLAERMTTTDPEIAKILIQEDLVIIPVKLSREQREDVFKEIAKSLLMTFDPDTMVDLVEQATPAMPSAAAATLWGTARLPGTGCWPYDGFFRPFPLRPGLQGLHLPGACAGTLGSASEGPPAR